MFTSKQFKLTRNKMLTLLDELDSLGETATTLYLPADISQSQVAIYLGQVSSITSVSTDVSKYIMMSQTGNVIFWGDTHKKLIIPPFPVLDKYLTAGYDTTPLRALLTRNNRIGIILVRLGSYSIGTCEGEKLVTHKTGTGLVHGRHRQGGSSAARFQRRRENQTYHFLERVGEHAREMFEPYNRKLDFFIYGGSRTAIEQLKRQCDFLGQFDSLLLPPLLGIPNPRFDVLEKAVTQIWSSWVIEWVEN